MDAIINIIKAWWDWNATWWDSFKTFFSDFWYGLFDSVLSAAQGLITSIPIPDALKNIDIWGGLPSQALYILDKLHIVTVLGIIAAGYGVRFALNLIPSWATRV